MVSQNVSISLSPPILNHPRSAHIPFDTQAFATTAEEFTPEPWACGYGPGLGETPAAEEESRILSGLDHDEDHDPRDQHDHSAHDHDDHSHDFDPSKTKEALEELQRSLRGPVLPIGKRRRMQGASYAYWVDLYIEIDRDLCNKNLELAMCDAGTIGPNTINYGELLIILESVRWNCFQHNRPLIS